MRGEVIQGWSMWSFIMASSGGDAVERKMKVTSWEVVVVVVIAIVVALTEVHDELCLS